MAATFVEIKMINVADWSEQHVTAEKKGESDYLAGCIIPVRCSLV